MIYAIQIVEGELGEVIAFDNKSNYRSYATGFNAGAAEYNGGAGCYTPEDLDEAYLSESQRKEAEKKIQEAMGG